MTSGSRYHLSYIIDTGVGFYIKLQRFDVGEDDLNQMNKVNDLNQMNKINQMSKE